MGWKWLKSLGPALLTALTTFLEVMGGLCIYFVGLAEDADTAAGFGWTLKGVAGVSIAAGAVTAAAAVAVSLPSRFQSSKFLRITAASLSVVASLLAGWYVGSLISSLTERVQPRESRIYAKQISAILAEIEHERHSAFERLSKVDSSANQARVAAALARSFARGAAAIRAIHTQDDDRRTTTTIVTRMEGLSNAYSGLAAAATNPHGSQKTLDRARQRVNRADRRLWTAEMTLQRHGYEIVAVRQPGGRHFRSDPESG